ncbi:MAG: hypothetical protein U1C46_10650 [Bacteroidales bacterium]|nr:hypothetical protein [Bacteroidales bacterium]
MEAKKLAASKIRSQFPVFLFFVLFSTSIWMVIKLSGEFTSPVVYELEYINHPAGKILISASDTTLTLGLAATGFELIRYKIWQKKPLLQVDLSAMPMLTDSRTFDSKLSAITLLKKLSLQLNHSSEVLFATPDTLSFRFAPEFRKKIPVLPDITYTLRQQYRLYENIKIQPDSILIKGVRSDLQVLDSIISKPASLADVYHNHKFILPLQHPNTQYPVILSADAIEVSMRVEKYTEASIELPVEVLCEVEGYTFRLFPSTVKVTYLVALIDFKRVDAALFSAFVFCDNKQGLSSNKLNIEIAHSPEYVEITRLEPDRVEYIKVKNAQ